LYLPQDYVKVVFSPQAPENEGWKPQVIISLIKVIQMEIKFKRDNRRKIDKLLIMGDDVTEFRKVK
jgi:hypothetical protein